MDDQRVSAYLERIGLAVEPPSADYLRRLQTAHLRSVPFESLSIHLGEPIVLEEDPLFSKIATGRRGGFCYELNGLFAGLLAGLGYDVTLHAAAVQMGPTLGPPFDHLVLRVVADGEPWLVDVGFGDFSHEPLRWDERAEQADPSGAYRLEEKAAGDLTVSRGGDAVYHVEQRARRLSDFVPTCWWQQTSADSHFTHATVCSLLTANGRDTIRDRKLIETNAGQRTEREVADDEELLALYVERFGVRLDKVPEPKHPQP
ncbi:arylamine N-acetyltransferase family protein [Flindersiella endophytica]